MTNEWRGRWPLACALLILWAVVAALLRLSLARTEGHLVYALDDPYIHMAIAKHLVGSGVWGVTPFAFSSSSSSPAWTALLAATYRLLGVGETAPLILNVVFASLALVVADASLRARLTSGWRFAALVALILLTPLPVVVMCGMEHTAHVTLSIAFAVTAAAAIAPAPTGERAAGRPGVVALATLGALLAAVRYEGLFAVAAVAILLAIGRRWRDAAVVVAAALLPLALFGAYSLAHGWPALPTSVLLKGGVHDLGQALLRLPKNLVKTPGLTVLMGVGLVAFLRDRRTPLGRWSEDRTLLALFLGMGGLHMLLASVGWFHRYEAYLKAVGLVAMARALPAWLAIGAGDLSGRRGGAARIAVATVALVLVARGGKVCLEVPLATQNIYQQQYQMGLFLAESYAGEAVAANDVGAINYLADIRCCDLYGLASLPIARLRRANKRPPTAEIDREVERCGARIAIAYASWFDKGLIAVGGTPPRWGAPVARWLIPDNWVCGSDTVSFFALRSGEHEILAARLRAFAPRLPRGVVVIADSTLAAAARSRPVSARDAERRVTSSGPLLRTTGGARGGPPG